MKKTIVFAVAILLSLAAFSQDSSFMRPMGGDSMNHKMMRKMKDCVMMRGGTPMVTKDGQTMPLTQTMTFPNGTAVMTDGTLKMKDGSTRMMKDGDCIYMDGTLSKIPMHNKMKANKDSTM